MNVTVEVVGGETRDVALSPDATYADAIRAVGYSPHEASALVDGSPVPEDDVVDADRVTVLRLIQGGAVDEPTDAADESTDAAAVHAGVDVAAAAAPGTNADVETDLDVRFRSATPDDHLDVVRVLDAALLEVDAADVEARIGAGDVTVAVTERSASDGGTAESIVGATVVAPRSNAVHLRAVAVRRERRGRGIGSALVAAALREAADTGAERLTAAFDRDLRPFYADLGFEIAARDGRLWGVRRLPDATERRS